MKPISKMAFVRCGIRMEDAESGRPVCGDSYAKRFMGEEWLPIMATFAGIKGSLARSKSANLARHRIIDDLLRREISQHPDLLAVVIGAGFDSRAYRLPGGTWVELDEAQLFAFKDERLPVTECPNTLHRIPIDFSCESLAQKLSAFSGRKPVAFVAEDFLMYRQKGQIRELLRSLGSVFPRHTLICELLTRQFLEKYDGTTHGEIQQLDALGETFQFAVPRPQELFQQEGYRLTEQISIVEKSVELGSVPMPQFLLRAVMPIAVKGYSVCVFDLG
jgi:methyltransferase (TIGR00027 family)